MTEPETFTLARRHAAEITLSDIGAAGVAKHGRVVVFTPVGDAG